MDFQGPNSVDFQANMFGMLLLYVFGRVQHVLYSSANGVELYADLCQCMFIDS